MASRKRCWAICWRRNLKKKPGDILEIQGTPFTVTGIYHGASALEADAMIMPLDQLQLLSSLQGKGVHD